MWSHQSPSPHISPVHPPTSPPRKAQPPTCWSASGVGWPCFSRGSSPKGPSPKISDQKWTAESPADCTRDPPIADPGLGGTEQWQLRLKFIRNPGMQTYVSSSWTLTGAQPLTAVGLHWRVHFKAQKYNRIKFSVWVKQEGGSPHGFLSTTFKRRTICALVQYFIISKIRSYWLTHSRLKMNNNKKSTWKAAFILISWTGKQNADGLKTLAEGHAVALMTMTLVLTAFLYVRVSQGVHL